MAQAAGGIERWGEEARRTVEKALSGAGPGASGDAFLEEIRRITVSRAAGSEEPAVWRHGRGAAVRSWAAGETVFSSADGPAGPALAACLADLSPAAGRGPVLEGSPAAGIWTEPAFREPGLDPARSFLSGLERSLGRRLVGVWLALDLERTDRITLVADESGSTGIARWGWTRLRVVAHTEGGVTASWLGGAPDLEVLRRTHTPQRLAIRIDRRLRGALVSRDALPVCEPATPVLFAAGNGGIVLHEFTHQLEGDLVTRGWSLWDDALQPNLSPAKLLTVWDDPNRPGLRGSYTVDDEGRAGERRLLVRRGKVLGRLGDRQRAEIDAKIRPGHGRRCSWREPPLPRASNLCLAAGDSDPRAVREERGLQLLIHDLEEGATDPRSGEMTLRVSEGEWLRNGRCLAPVSGLDLEGNVLDLLARVDRVCTDRQADSGAATCRRQGRGVPIGFFTPSFRARGLREIR